MGRTIRRMRCRPRQKDDLREPILSLRLSGCFVKAAIHHRQKLSLLRGRMQTAPAAQHHQHSRLLLIAYYTWERKCTGKNEEQECNPLFRLLNDGEKNKREKDGYDASIFQTIRKVLLRMRNW
jgi:hypothetical protein